MNKIMIIATMICFAILPLSAQTLSLKECIDYARNNNSSIKVSKMNSEVSSIKVKELIGSALPQIDATGTFTDNVLSATQMMPAEMFGGESGTYFALKTGMQYDMTGKLALTQKILDFSFYAGLKAAKVSDTLFAKQITQKAEEVFYNVSNAYYKAVVLKKQVDNYKQILSASEKILKTTENKFLNGAEKKLDVDKIRVSYNNTKSQLTQAELNYLQAINNLKYTMSMPLNTALNLQEIQDDSLSSSFKISNDSNNLKNRIDYKIQELTISLKQVNQENVESAYYPTLSFFTNCSIDGMRNKFDYLRTDKNWYSSAALGLTLKVPVFSGFSDQAKVEQAKINVEIEKENLKNMELSIQNDMSNYFIQLKNAIQNIQNEKDNLILAQSVYDNSMNEYSQGKSSSLELIQAESSLRETQNNYYSKLLNLYLAQLDYEKNKGTLNDFINNLK